MLQPDVFKACPYLLPAPVFLSVASEFAPGSAGTQKTASTESYVVSPGRLWQSRQVPGTQERRKEQPLRLVPRPSGAPQTGWGGRGLERTVQPAPL